MTFYSSTILVEAGANATNALLTLWGFRLAGSTGSKYVSRSFPSQFFGRPDSILHHRHVRALPTIIVYGLEHGLVLVHGRVLFLHSMGQSWSPWAYYYVFYTIVLLFPYQSILSIVSFTLPAKGPALFTKFAEASLLSHRGMCGSVIHFVSFPDVSRMD